MFLREVDGRNQVVGRIIKLLFLKNVFSVKKTNISKEEGWNV